MTKHLSYVSRVAGLLLLVIYLACAAAHAAVQVIGAQYQPDQLFPEYDCLWHDRNYPTSCSANISGCHLHVFIKNTGGGSVTVSDVTVKGYSLETILKDGNISGARSIYYYWDNPPADVVTAVGEPVWYKANPKAIPAGGVGQVVVRLRYIPTDPQLAVGVVTSAGTVTTNITVDANAPQLARVGFMAGLTNATLHWRRSGGAAPVSVWMDGTNVTANTTTVGDASLNFAASVVNFSAPLSNMTYHVFQGVYADGKTATVGLRAWANKFIYAMYGTFDQYTDEEWVVEAGRHGINNCQLGGIGTYLSTSAGRAAAAEYDFGYTCQDLGHLSGADPDMWFLNDEPDAQEDNQASTHCGTGLTVPCSGHSIGILTMYEIAHGEELQAVRPLTPTTVNMDGTLKPGNYIGWGQSVDILQVDPYYQRRLSDTYWYYPERISLYKKATYIYAVSRAVAAAAEPNPSNVLLYSCQWKDANLDKIWPFAPPACKRIEVYYALAGGATGMGYWWSNPNYPSKGLSDQSSQAARDLWKEIGLCGMEIKTARSLLVRSTPVNLPMTASTNVWVRSLASGTDSLVLLVVNDNYFNDTAGCHYTNVPNATVTVTLPGWMQPSPLAFEIWAGGLRAVNTQLNGNQLQINLGTLQVTRMIVLTTDGQVPLRTQQWYNQKVRWGICDIASGICSNSAPFIVVPPQNEAVLLGDDATFAVTAGGTPSPGYQWRFNGANLAGATSASYTRTDAQASHGGGYSVVVSNSLGSVTSVVANLSVSTNGFPPSIITPPQSQIVEKGQDATFTVTASGSQPLSYQWRFNNSNLAGATSSSYARFDAQTNDAGNYTVVITNGSGAITSAPATLTVTGPIICVPVTLVSGDFEGATNANGTVTGWTTYEVNSPAIKVWSIQTASPPGGSQYQQIQAYNAAHTASAGVRQNVTGCTIGATYQVTGWYRSNSDYGRARVRVSPTASTDWDSAVDLNPVADYGSITNWATFSGTVVATGTNMTLWLDGRTINGTSGKVGCFDAVTVTCLGPATPLRFDSATSTLNQISLVLSGPAGSNVTVLCSSNLVSWVTLTNLANPTGTVPFTDASTTNVLRRFYRATSP
jgi:hypothetical protein